MLRFFQSVIGGSRIGRRFTVAIVVVSSIITLATSALQLAMDYRRDMNLVRAGVENIRLGQMQTLRHSLWNADSATIEVQLKSLLPIEGVEYLKVTTDMGATWEAGQVQSRRTRTHTFTIEYTAAEPMVIGRLEVVTGLDPLIERLFDRVLVIVGGNAVKTFLVALFALTLFHLLVTRHLARLSEYAGSLDPGRSMGKLKLDRKKRANRPPDELDAVTDAFDALLDRIDATYKNLHASKEGYRNLIASMSAGFALHDMLYDDAGRPADYRFLEVNRAFERMTGLKAADIVGRTVLEVLPETEAHWIDTYGRVASTGASVNLESFSEPLQRHFSVVAYRPAPDQFAVMFTDVTDKKNAEKEQAALKASLEQKVQKRTADLNQRIDEAERLNKAMINLLDDLQMSNRRLEALSNKLTEANQELEAFTYSVSHDLRAPLRGIDGFSKALLEDYADRLDQQGAHYLHRVRLATQRMGGLIDDLLRLSRVSRAELKQMPLDVSQMVREIADQLAKADPQRRVDLDITPGVRGRADPQLIHIVLENLLANAFKFTRHRESARIAFGCDDSGAERVFWVRDNGAGFDPRYVDKLFGAFQRLHHMDEFEGTGIGLSIVKRIVQRHGGRVWAEGAEDRGAAFFFTLSPPKEET